MLPTINDDLTSDFEIEEIPAKTYKLVEGESELYFSNTLTELESVRQAIFFALNVERYKHIIYSWNYGIELSDLFGQSMDYVISTLKSRIEETLLMDDRVESVSDFSYKKSKGKLIFNFTVNTIYGEVDATKEVEI